MARRLVEGRMRRSMVIEAVLRAMRRDMGNGDRTRPAQRLKVRPPVASRGRVWPGGWLFSPPCFSISFVIYMANGYSLDGRRGYSLGSGDSVPAALIPVTLALDGTVMLTASRTRSSGGSRGCLIG